MHDHPLVFRVRQTFEHPTLVDPPAAVEEELSHLSLGRSVHPGQSVAITAGSRGIHDIHRIIRAIVDHFRMLEAKPFIVPAMGSHGGATAVGQRRILESYGITEDFCGCPIRASMETVEVCLAAEGFPVHFDRHAFEADHVVVCNRIKPHTLFVGDIESGLMKMMLIGLGKHAGATVYHRAIRDFSFARILDSVTQEVLQRCSIVAGLAIVENSHCRTAAIEAVAPADFVVREKALLAKAKRWLPRLPFAAADILLVDEIGKNISGSGMDLNVVGRKFLMHQAAEHETPKIRMIAVRDLAKLTHGSAVGIGLAEFCRRRVLEKMDVEMTRVNALTGGYFHEAMLPLDYVSDREMLAVMATQVGLVAPRDVKIIWVRNTRQVAEVECGSGYLEEARVRADLEILTAPRPLIFDAEGNLDDAHMDVGSGSGAA